MSDLLLRGTLDGANLRFFAIDSTNMVNRAKKIHNTIPVATIALGRFITMAALMGAMLKNSSERLTITIDGSGPGGKLVACSDSNSRVKGYLTNPAPQLQEDGDVSVGGFVGNIGKLNVIRDVGLKQPYIGQSKLRTGEIAEDFAYYFLESEQLPSIVSLGVTLDETGSAVSAGGIIIQAMPGCPDVLIDKIENRSLLMSDISRQLKEFELREYIEALFRDLKIEVYDSTIPHYQCDCSRDRTKKALYAMGREELSDIISKEGRACVRCHFCNKEYIFEKDELLKLMVGDK